MKLLNYVLWLVAIILSFYLLIVGRELLIPFVLALFIWYLINVLSVVIGYFSFKGKHLPRSIAFALSILAIILILSTTVNLITNNITHVVNEAPTYQENLDSLIVRGFEFFKLHKLYRGKIPSFPTAAEGDTSRQLESGGMQLGIQEQIDLNVGFKVKKPALPRIDELIQKLNLTVILSRVAGVLTNFISSTGIIIIYLIFLFLEQGYFKRKLAALVPDPKRLAEIFTILERIAHDTRMYVGIKTLTSLLTAVFSYLILRLVGLDFAAFWAFLIFVLNFIPFIGSIIATVLPALLAIIQYDTFTQFFVVAGGVTAVQFTVANFIEPRLMGQSLNLSPLVILLSLALWGTLWGIAGMFLCVPLTVIAMIIFSHFPQTKPIAIILSKDGRIRKK